MAYTSILTELSFAIIDWIIQQFNHLFILRFIN